MIASIHHQLQPSPLINQRLPQFTFTLTPFILVIMHLSTLSPRGGGGGGEGGADVAHLTFCNIFFSNSPPKGRKFWSKSIKYPHPKFMLNLFVNFLVIYNICTPSYFTEYLGFYFDINTKEFAAQRHESCYKTQL